MEAKIINLPKFLDRRGNLSFIEELQHIPFEIRRSFWITNVPANETRGGHAFHKNQELIVALAGEFSITLDDGKSKETYTLNSPDKGLFVAPKVWRTLSNFSPDAVCLVVASTPYNPEDYIHSYDEFINHIS